MTIQKNQNGSEITIALDGRLDTITAPELEAEVKSSLDGIDSLIFDLAKLNYVSSAGLRTLLLAQKNNERSGQNDHRQRLRRSPRDLRYHGFHRYIHHRIIIILNKRKVDAIRRRLFYYIRFCPQIIQYSECR